MYLVAGASTAVGRELVPRLLRRGLPVRVLVRKAADARHFAALGAQVAVADVRDGAAVRRAAEGAKTFVSLIGRHFARTEAGLWEVEVGGNAALVAAAVEVHAEHFVLLSVLWSDRDPGPVLFRAKRRAEDLLMRSALRYSILRPAMFASGANSLIGILGPPIERWGVAPIPAPDSGPIAVLTLADLADALLAAAVAPGPENRVYELGGPQAITLADAAGRIGAVLHKKVRLLRLPRSSLRAGRVLLRAIGFAAYEAMLFLEMLADHGYHCDPVQTRALLGREPQTVEDALGAHYSHRPRTRWADSFYGTLLFGNQ
jgi:uncharacterized protein YbjT (DUF2867 family)